MKLVAALDSSVFSQVPRLEKVFMDEDEVRQHPKMISQVNNAPALIKELEEK